MTEFQEDLLAKHGYIKQESEFVEYKKHIEMGELTIQSHIEVYDNINPDNLAYQGVVTLYKDGDRIVEWDSERKYKLLDVLTSCQRITGLMQTLLKLKA